MNQIDPPVFSKKEKIIIASIFAILFLASIIVTVYLVSEGYPGGFEGVNAAPIAAIIISLSEAAFAYALRHRDVHVYHEYSIFRHPLGGLKAQDYTYDTKYLKTHCIEIFLVLSQIPIQIPLIVYIQTFEQAILSLVICYIPYIVLIVAEIVKFKGHLQIKRTHFVPVIVLLIVEAIKRNLPSVRKERKIKSEIKEREERDSLQQRFRDRY